MDTIIGLGSVGARIAKEFGKKPQYNVITIDHDEDATICIPEKAHPEEYESSCPDLSNKFSSVSSETLFVLSGASIISGASLRILQQLHDKTQLNILYIRPDVDTLSETRKLQERVVFGVLQEYARSGVFNQFYVVDNQLVDDILGGAPIMGYYDRLNEIIVATIHMVNVFNHSEAIVGTLSKPSELCRISTFGILNPETGEESLFFDLNNTREKSYYYAIPEDSLKNDKGLMGSIKNQVKDTPQEKDVKISYGVFSTGYSDKYAYIVANSSQVQSEKKA
jgi:hypothetical protein